MVLISFPFGFNTGKDMLRETVSPTMKWEQALPLIKNDERMKVIKGIGEQRRLFKDWINQTKNQERQEVKQRMQRVLFILL